MSNKSGLIILGLLGLWFISSGRKAPPPSVSTFYTVTNPRAPGASMAPLGGSRRIEKARIANAPAIRRAIQSGGGSPGSTGGAIILEGSGMGVDGGVQIR